MIICEVNKNHLNVRTKELLTAGSQNVNTVEFRFNAAWDGLTKTATFKTSKKTISVLLNTNTTAIPWEALADAGEILAVGVFGVSGETLVLPTVWGILGKVMDAAHLGDEEKEPTPDVYQKILDELNALERPTWDSVQNKPFSTLGSGLSVDENGVLSAQGGGSADNVRIIDATDDIWGNGEHTLNMTIEEYQNILEWYRNQQSGVAKNILLNIDNRLVFQLVYIDGVGMTFIYSNSGYNRYVKVSRSSNEVIATTRDIAGLTKSLMEASYLCNTGHKDDIIALFNMTTVGVIRGAGDSVPDNGESIRYPALVFFGDEISYGNTYATLIDRNGVMWSIYIRLGSGVIELAEKTDYVTNTALTDILQSYVSSLAFRDALQKIGQAIGTKLDKNQGASNAGKILGIGADGIVVPQDKPSGGTVTVDDALSSTSTNPVQNKVVTAALAEKITAPTTAAVGQIIKVKSVDDAGKPTEWEAADMPSGGGKEEPTINNLLCETVFPANNVAAQEITCDVTCAQLAQYKELHFSIRGANNTSIPNLYLSVAGIKDAHLIRMIAAGFYGIVRRDFENSNLVRVWTGTSNPSLVPDSPTDSKTYLYDTFTVGMQPKILNWTKIFAAADKKLILKCSTAPTIDYTLRIYGVVAMT